MQRPDYLPDTGALLVLLYETQAFIVPERYTLITCLYVISWI